MRFLLITIVALGISPVSLSALAKSPDKRKTASSISAFVLSPSAPQVQKLENEDAKREVENLFSYVPADSKTDDLNLEEFRDQIHILISRGYKLLSEPLKGSVFSPAKTLTLHKVMAKDSDDLQFDLYFTQFFVKEGETPKSDSILPKLILRGNVFCAAKSADCEKPKAHFRHTIIEWAYLPSGRGGDSSSGGINR